MNAADLVTVLAHKSGYWNQKAKGFPQSRFDYDATGNTIYIGIAYRGALAGDAAWIIAKLTYDGSNQCTQIQTSPEGSVWDNRATTVTYA
jgi:hypothetical protein